MSKNGHPAEVLADKIRSGQTQWDNLSPALDMLRRIPALEADLADAQEKIGALRAQAKNDAALMQALNAERDQLRNALQASEASDAESLAMYRRCRDERDQLHAELRRLHGEFGRTERRNIELRADEVERLRAQEPVAYMERLTSRLADPHDEHRTRWPMCYDPLYAAPQPPAAPRQPLTDEQATLLVQHVVSTSERPIGMVAYGLRVLRATERAHGINAAATTPSAPSAPADRR